MAKFWIILFLLFNVGQCFATSRWEVAVLFLAAEEDDGYQKDIDHNVLELARSHPNDLYRLSLYRESPERSVEYYPDPKSSRMNSWEALFHFPPTQSTKVPGELYWTPRKESTDSILSNRFLLRNFFRKSFRDPNAKRILIVYSHGEAFEGLGKSLELDLVKSELQASLPARKGVFPLDILWLDACFMANLEAAFELRRLAPVLVASEEAEFSAGAPFDMLHQLGKGPDDRTLVAHQFAERFIESYSYAKKGAQRRAIFSSPATISVIETQKLGSLVERVRELKLAIGRLDPEQRKWLRKAVPQISMERADLLDLGALVRSLKGNSLFPSLEVQRVAGRISEQLELTRPALFQSNPRVSLTPPSSEKLSLVYGYQEWTRGYQGDSDTWQKVPKELKNKVSFVPGLALRKWPALELLETLFVAPYSVDMNLFHYYFQTGKGELASKVVTLKRENDFAYFPAETSQNPVLFTGYTQGIGEHADRYSGISILSPIEGIPSLNYPDLEFSKITNWQNL